MTIKLLGEACTLHRCCQDNSPFHFLGGKKDTGLGKTFENLTPMAICENEIQPSKFIISRTHRRLFDNKEYFLAVYDVNVWEAIRHRAQ